MRKYILFAVALLSIAACSRKGTGKLLPSVSGKAGEVLVVMEKSAWEGESGSVIRELLSSDTPYLAQREPLFNLVNVIPSSFINLFQVHRNIILYDINSQVQEEGVRYLNDIWARPQCVIKISAASEENGVALLKAHGEVIAEAIEQAERDRIIANARLYEAGSIAPEVAKVMGGSPHFPSGYKIKKITPDFVWVEDMKQFTTLGVFVYRYPARGDSEDFTLGKIVSHRNAALMENVPGMFDNTYMTTSTFISPTLKFLKYKDRDFAQVRGFWEVYNDYMGGPFVSHSFYSPDGKWVVVEEAFVYAPKYDKRQYLRQVESLLYSFE